VPKIGDGYKLFSLSLKAICRTVVVKSAVRDESLSTRRRHGYRWDL